MASSSSSSSSSGFALPGDLSQDRFRLLEHVLDVHFGSVAKTVASTLMKRGTLTFQQLVSLCHLPPRIVADTIFLLSAHSVLRHFESDVNGKLTETFTIDMEAIENRLRASLFAEHANQSWKGMDRVINELFINGMLNESHLVKCLKDELWMHHQMGTLTNGPSSKKGKGKARAFTSERDAEREARQLFLQAVRKGYVAVVTVESQMSEESLIDQWRIQLLQNTKGSIPTAKEKREMEDIVSERLSEHRALQRRVARGANNESEAETRKRKRRKQDEDSDDSDDWSPNDLPRLGNKFFRINSEGFHLHMRSRIMRKYAEDIFTPAVGIFFGLFLDAAESSPEMTMEAEEWGPISNSTILQAFASKYRESDVIESFALSEKDDRTSWRKPRRLQDVLYESLICLSRSDDRRLWFDGSMQPRPHPRAFLKNVTGAGDGTGPGGKWSILFAHIGRRIKRTIIENTILDQLGIEAVRVFKILLEKGFLEEKIIARLAFLAAKDARETIARLRERGWISLQEVSRTSDRAASRTIFLWGVNYDQVVEKAVTHCYKALANVESQKAYQIEMRKTVVEKRQRWEKDKKAVVMTATERDAIKELDWVIEALTVAQQRIDRDLFVLRYFHSESSVLVRS